MSRPRGSSGPGWNDDRGGTTAVVVAGLLMVVCCAGPLLVAGGAVGGALRDPWLITVEPVVVLAAVVDVLWCRVRRRGAGPEDCCPSVTSPSLPTRQAERGRRPAHPRRPVTNGFFCRCPQTAATGCGTARAGRTSSVSI